MNAAGVATRHICVDSMVHGFLRLHGPGRWTEQKRIDETKRPFTLLNPCPGYLVVENKNWSPALEARLALRYAVCTAPPFAAVFTVTNTNDSGAGSSPVPPRINLTRITDSTTIGRA